MTFKDFAAQTDGTAIYPNADTDLTYPTLGLVDEIAEVLEVQFGLNDFVVGPAAEEHGPVLAKECGDVAWYAARIAKVIGRVDAISGALDNPLVVRDASPRGGHTPEEFMALEGGRVAGIIKKSIRDNGGVLEGTKVNEVADALLNILICLDAALDEFYSSVTYAMDLNVEKLQDRKERGVLGGSGDNR